MGAAMLSTRRRSRKLLHRCRSQCNCYFPNIVSVPILLFFFLVNIHVPMPIDNMYWTVSFKKLFFIKQQHFFFSSCYFHTNPSAMYSDKSKYFAQFYWFIHFNFLTFNSRMFSHFFIFSCSPLGVSRFPFPTLYLAFLIPLIHVRDKISEMYILNLDRYKYYYP